MTKKEMKALIIPAAVCKVLEQLEPVTRQILLGHIYDYRVLGLLPDVSEEGEMIRFIWPLIVGEYVRLNRQTERTRKSRECYSNVTVTQEVPPSPKEKKSPHPLKEKDTSSPEEKLVEEWFDRFYALYPKHEGRKPALAKFKAIMESEKEPEKLLTTILSKLQKQIGAKKWTKDNYQYIPLPATYLNQRRWEDEVVELTHSFRNAPRKADNWIGTPAENIENVF